MMKQSIVCGLLAMVSLTSATSPLFSPPPIPYGGHPPHVDPGWYPWHIETDEPEPDPPGITQVVESFHVRSDIRYRFATTQMSSVVRNVGDKAQEIGFEVTLPKDAFIMAFHMTIDGKRYDGEVKERQEAKRVYQAAVDKGQSAGHVRQAPRHANVFEVAVNVAAGSAVNFTLTYQEVLRRRLGIYEHEIHVSPGQPVEDFRIEVNILENRPLKFVRTPALRTDFLLTNQVGGEGVNEMTVVDRPSPESASVLYSPSLSEQGDEEGISARFVVQYDVEHAGPTGDVLVVDGYFVHFMAPDSLTQTLPKDIIFVLDVSGSMYGTKIKQLQVAMATILSNLKPEDRFNIITFSSDASKWKEGLVQADESNIAIAQTFVKNMRASGMTNINDALLTALSEMKSRHNKERVGMIFFLTDGDPTEGEQNPKKIARNVVNANERTVAIFTLAFGEGADYELLKSLSAQNLGFARKIYEASDAALQVSSLYNEISAVSIKDMNIKYQNSSVDEFSLTDTEFPIVFNGTEIMICGFLHDDAEILEYDITGMENTGEIDIRTVVDSVKAIMVSSEPATNQLFSGPRDFSGMVERMWAYQTIKQLLQQKVKHATHPSKVKELEKKILELSLKYKFVTPLTSMVVTKPDLGMTEVKEANRQEMSDSMLVPGPGIAPNPAGNGGPLFQASFIPGKARLQGRRLPNPPSVAALAPPFGAPPPWGAPPATGDLGIQFDLDPMASTYAPSVPWYMPLLSTTEKTTTTRMPTTTSAPSTVMTTRKTTASTPATTSRQPSLLKLVTLNLGLNSQPPPLICMVPRMWKYGNIILISQANASRVILTQCKKRNCPNNPSIKSLRFENGQFVTEVKLDGSYSWRYSSSSAFNVSVISNTELRVLGSGLTATIKRTSNDYSLNLTAHVKGSKGAYSGLLGQLFMEPDRLQRLTKKRAKKVCVGEGSKYNVVVYNKLARNFSVYRTRKNSKKF